MSTHIKIAKAFLTPLLMAPLAVTQYFGRFGLTAMLIGKGKLIEPSCSIDIDCPRGFVCVAGTCVDLEFLGESPRVADAERTVNSRYG